VYHEVANLYGFCLPVFIEGGMEVNIPLGRDPFCGKVVYRLVIWC